MIKQHVTRTIIFGIIGLLIGIAIAAFSPRVYEGRTDMVVGVQNDSNQVLTQLNEDVRAIIQKGLNSNVATELQILRGKSIFYDALRRLSTQENKPDIWENRERYYAMYDVIGDKESNAAQVQARMYDPRLAAELANAVADSYNDTRQASARKSVDTALRYLEVQAIQADKLVKDNEEALKKLKEVNHVPDLQGKVLNLNSYHTQLKGFVDSALATQHANDAQIAVLEGQLKQFPETSVGSRNKGKSARVAQLEGDLELQRTRLAAARAQYEEDSTEVRQQKETTWNVQNRLAEARKRGMDDLGEQTGKDLTHEQVQQQLNQALAQRPAIAQQLQKWSDALAKNEAELNALPAIEKQLVDKGREVQISENNLRQLKSQEATLQNRGLIVPAAGTVLAPAVPDKDPVAPDPAKMAFVGLAGGLSFGLLFSLGLESLRARLYSSQQLAELTGLPVAATVPLMPRPAARRMLQGLSRRDGPLIESLRFLAFSSTAKPGEHVTRVMFTSNGDNSGCSTAAGQYAAAVARTGVRVLLVDGNLRQPTLSRVFAADSKSGVSDILSRNLLPSDQSLVLDTEQPNLRILPAGSADESSIKEVSTANLAAFLDSLSTYADLVVIDAPPCNIMADASRLAPYVDEVFLVVSAASASARNVPAAFEILNRSGAKKVSLIMTHASPTEESFSRQADYMLSRS